MTTPNMIAESTTTEQWEDYMKKWLEPDSDETDQAVLVILRELLLASDSNDHSPVQTAAQKLLALYRDFCLDEDFDSIKEMIRAQSPTWTALVAPWLNWPLSLNGTLRATNALQIV